MWHLVHIVPHTICTTITFKIVVCVVRNLQSTQAHVVCIYNKCIQNCSCILLAFILQCLMFHARTICCTYHYNHSRTNLVWVNQSTDYLAIVPVGNLRKHKGTKPYYIMAPLHVYHFRRAAML